MRELQSFGAAGEVTGSCHVVTDNNNQRVLVDYGMFQGSHDQHQRNFIPPDFDPQELSGVVLTHAHFDHSGRLPFLTQSGYEGPIYTTEPTADLVRLVLNDSARIQKMNARYGQIPLYSSRDVAAVMRLMQPIPYDQEFTVGNFSATFRDAGHILGSASVEMTEGNTLNGETIVFSGDLGNDDPKDIVKAKSMIDRADIVVMETTYGDREHGEGDPEEILQEEINAIEQNGGALLIPAFSIEKTQRLLHLIRELKEGKKVKAKTKVFLDSPMGHQATGIFKRYKGYLRDEVSEEKDPFNFDGLNVTTNANNRKLIDTSKGPKIIIAGSGMMNGGRIREHAINYLERPSTRLLLTGYQGEGTLGRLLQEGVKEVMIDHELVRVNASINSLGSLSSHAGQEKLMEWVSHPEGVRKAVLVHGDARQREVFSGKVQSELGIPTVLPQRGEIVDLRPQVTLAAD